jgi:hypothetical protein
MAIIPKIMAMNEDMLAYRAVVTGEFQKEIARFESLVKQYESKLGLIQTVEAAHEQAAIITGKVQATLDAAEDKHKQAVSALADVEKQKTLVQARENAARELDLQVKSQYDALQLQKDAHEINVATPTAKLVSSQAALDKSAQAVAEQKAEVDAKAAKIALALKGL